MRAAHVVGPHRDDLAGEAEPLRSLAGELHPVERGRAAVRKNAEAAKTLEFLDAQLPELKVNLEKAERALEGYRAAKGSIDVTMEAQASVTRAVDIEKAISEVKVEMAALQQRFTGDHPLRERYARHEGEDARSPRAQGKRARSAPFRPGVNPG